MNEPIRENPLQKLRRLREEALQKFGDIPPGPPPPPKPRAPPGPLKLGPRGPHLDFLRATTQLPEPISFWFRTRKLSALATPADYLHHNVLRLQVQPSITQSIIQALISRLPSIMRRWFESAFPEWTLPSSLVLKTQKKGWEDEFEVEKATYAKLKPLQGIVIPKLYGQVSYDKTRSLLLSDVGGVNLSTPAGSLLELSEFRRLLRQALTAIAQFGVEHGDQKLDNYHLVDGKIMVVDFEVVNNEPRSEEQLKLTVESGEDWLADWYDRNRYYMLETGQLSIPA